MNQSKSYSELVYDQREKFKAKYNLSDIDFSNLWELFLEYGMTRGEAPHRSRANHYYLQGISEHLEIEWSCWKGNMTKELKAIIKEKYPQLMITDKKLSKNKIKH